MGEVKNSVAPEDYIKHVPLLLFQTGYLTFAPTAEQEKSEYGLIFPNLDIKEPFSQLIAQALCQKSSKMNFPK